MAASRKCDVLIVGAGPAGLASALFLLRRRPGLAGRIVAIEKARHPRPKVCGGGLIPKTMLALAELGLELEVPAFEVRRGRARTEVGAVEIGDGGDVLCTIVRRDQFDARLARAAREAGLEIVENCRALGIQQGAAGVRVASERGVFEAEVTVVADGSGSRIAAQLMGARKHSIGRAITTDIAVNPEQTQEFAERLYRFDFNCVGAGIRGYGWSFPCLIGGRPHLNVGIYDQCPRLPVDPGGAKASLVDQLLAAFPDLPLEGLRTREVGFKAFPIRWYDGRDHFAAQRAILAGDAAGVDPLMGEGISCAFEHGKLAAAGVASFLDGDRTA
ncbi:MAG: FAD-dependent oxidoreductase, partial [Candidatus Binataceae bacterium]